MYIMANLDAKKKKLNPVPIAKQGTANQLLDYELAQHTDSTLSNYFENVDSCDEYASLAQINWLVNVQCEEMLSGLRERFDKPRPRKRRNVLLMI